MAGYQKTSPLFSPLNEYLSGPGSSLDAKTLKEMQDMIATLPPHGPMSQAQLYKELAHYAGLNSPLNAAKSADLEHRMAQYYAPSSQLNSAAAQAATASKPPERFMTQVLFASATKEMKSQRAIERLVDQLPMSVAARIRTVRLLCRFDHQYRRMDTFRYEVVFDTEKKIEFDEVNDFPNDAVIGRLCLECP